MTTTNKYASLELGTIEAVFNKLGGLEGAQRFLRGDSEIVIKSHVINCDADLFVPDGYSVEEHIKGGELRWNPKEIKLYLCDEQKGYSSIQGHMLRKKLKNKSVLNSNVLSYLLKNQQLIPNQWKGKFIFFWGTIYRDSDGDQFVHNLDWGNGEWFSNYLSLDSDFGRNYLAAVSVVSN